MGKQHNIFISWSGERSGLVARALREWLPMVIQAAEPWLSATDIDKGSRGLSDVVRALGDIRVGIVCLTPENLNSPWILYEAGALSKSIDERTRLCTYLIGRLSPEDVEPPLGMFQHTKATKEDTRNLLHTVNAAVSDDPLPSARLDTLFEALWPQFDAVIAGLPHPKKAVDAKRSVEEMMAELLELSRHEVFGRREELIVKLQVTEAELRKMHDGFQMADAALQRVREEKAAAESQVARLKEELKSITPASLLPIRSYLVKIKGEKSERIVEAVLPIGYGDGRFTLVTSDGKRVEFKEVESLREVNPSGIQEVEQTPA